MITIVTGLPGSGKSTWARRQAAENAGYVLDADEVLATISGAEVHAAQYPHSDFKALTAAFWDLAKKLDAQWRHIYLIRTMPSDYELFRNAGGCRMVWVETRPELCRQRCAQRLVNRVDDWEELLTRRNEFLQNNGARLQMVSGEA